MAKVSVDTAMGQAFLDKGIQTTDDLAKKAQAAAERKPERPVAKTPAQEPDEPPKRRSVVERMNDEFIPLDQILAAESEINAALESEDRQYAAERAAGMELFQEIKELRKVFEDQLRQQPRRYGAESRDTKALDGLKVQLRMRRALAAEKLGENDLDHLEHGDDLIYQADSGEQFNQLHSVLNKAIRYGFFVPISDKRVQTERDAGRGHYVFTHRCRDEHGKEYTHCFPKTLTRKLDRHVVWRVRELRTRAAQHADRLRAQALSILDAGPLPEPANLLRMLNPQEPLERAVTFGCALVNLGVRDQRTQAVRGHHGVAEIVIENSEAGQRCIGVTRAADGMERVLKIASAPILLAGHGGGKTRMPDWARALARHLVDICAESLLTDEEVEKRNTKLAAQKHYDEVIPSRHEERERRLAELRGDIWRERNAEWIAKQRKPRGKKKAAKAVSAEAREMLGLLKAHRASGVDLAVALHPKYQVAEPVEFAVFVRDLLHGGNRDEAARIYSGVVHLRVSPSEDGSAKDLMLVGVAGDLAKLLPEPGKVWQLPGVKAPPSAVRPMVVKIMPKDMPGLLLAHLHKRGFGEEACGMPALLHFAPGLAEELAEGEKAKKTRGPVIEHRGSNGSAAPDAPVETSPETLH